MLPVSIGMFTRLLKSDGHDVALFDTTVYKDLDPTLDFDKEKEERLNARPFDDTVLADGARYTNAYEDFITLVNNFNPDLIAVSLTEDMFPLAIKLLSCLGKEHPPVVAGGVFPTFAPELMLRLSEGFIDMALTGEGEETLPELCRRMDCGESIDTIPGLVRQKGNGFVRNSLPALVDVSRAPLPDYSLFETSRFYRPMQGKARRMLPVSTARGCPYTCAYCNSPSQNKIYKDSGMQFLRKYPIEIIRDEIRMCRDEYKADSIYFWADTFLVWNERELDQFCEMYDEFRLPFWIQTRPETITREKIIKLKQVGLLRIAFGLEHGNAEFRKKILHRSVSNDSIVNKIETVTELGIPVSINNIIGFPTETRELAFDTVEINRRFTSDGVNAYSYIPFNGTPLRKVAEDLGYIEKDSLAQSLGRPTMLSMPEFPKEEIEGIKRCFVLYVKMPKSRWPDIKRAEQFDDEGDRLWNELRKECADNYMNYSDYEPGEENKALDQSMIS